MLQTKQTQSINLMDIVPGTTTNMDAVSLQLILNQLLKNNSKIILSMKGATPMSSSFLNSSLGTIIEDYGFDMFKRYISIVDCRKTTANSLRKYFQETKTSCLA